MKNYNNRRNSQGKRVKREQPKKDSREKRVNFDNERIDKFDDPKCTSKSNDVRWYARTPELLKSAASIPFSTTTGTQLPWNAWGLNNAMTTVPGVMSLGYLHSIGGTFTDPINAAKDSVYSYVVHANSRNTSYSSSDLMMVILAGAEIFSTIAMGIRAFGLMKLFDQRSKYLPEVLVDATGFNYKDLQANYSQMWFDLNEMIARSTQIWIPNTMPFLDRWFWMNSNIYMDSSSVKGQYYVFKQRMFWLFDETASNTGSSLSFTLNHNYPGLTGGYVDLDAGSLTWAAYKQMVNDMFEALLNSEDRGVMMGDMLKAYGPENIYALKPIEATYAVVPVYDQEVLSQIENASVIDNVWAGVVQDEDGRIHMTNVILGGSTSPFKITSNMVALEEEVLNFHQIDTPTPEQVMVATRLKALGSTPFANTDQSADTGKLANIEIQYCGTEIVTHIYIYGYRNGGLVPQKLTMHTSSSTLQFYQISEYVSFDWAPWMYVNGTNWSVNTGMNVSDYNPPYTLSAVGDYDNYTIVDKLTLSKMHTTALYSEFGVPTI